MQYRKLGRSGLYVSALTYGTWISGNSATRLDDARTCIVTALDHGITSFDTADTYSDGAAEKVLGSVVSGSERDSVEITTHVYFPTGAGPNDRGLSRKHVLRGAEHALRRLGTDYIDVISAHRYDSETPLEETMLAFADVIRAGKAMYMGVSEWRPDELRRGVEIAHEIGISLVVNQSQYSMLWRVPEAEVMPVSEDLGISQVVWSPLAQGVLSGKYRPGTTPPPGSRGAHPGEPGGSSTLSNWLADDVLGRVEELRTIAESAGRSTSALALAWVLHSPHVASAIIGASRPEQIISNVQATQILLDAGEHAQLNELFAPVAERDPGLVDSYWTRP